MIGADDTGTAATIGRDLVGLAEAIASAGAAIRDGVLLDLTGLDQRVGALCQAIERLPGDQRSGMAGHLLGLIAGLDQLSEDIARQRAQLEESGGGTAAPGLAAAAYRKTPG